MLDGFQNRFKIKSKIIFTSTLKEIDPEATFTLSVFKFQMSLFPNYSVFGRSSITQFSRRSPSMETGAFPSFRFHSFSFSLLRHFHCFVFWYPVGCCCCHVFQ